MIDVIATIGLLLAFAFAGMIAFAVCKMASESDMISEEEWEEFLKEEEENESKMVSDEN